MEADKYFYMGHRNISKFFPYEIQIADIFGATL
jgi:hypothetical protein